MAPGPESEIKYCCGGFNPDDIVITGIAGRFPDSDNVGELCAGLYSGKDFVLPTIERRFEKGSMGLQLTGAGLLKDLSKFDADFFGMAASNAHDTDPLQRLLLQVSYEAIMDSGYDPQDLKGHNIGVYNAISELEAKEIRQKDPQRSRNAAGYLRCMNANQCSFYFDFHGPSLCIDTACSSSATALSLAFKDIRAGHCEAALVTGGELILSPEAICFYQASGICSLAGKSSPFDANSSGMIRSETVTALFIQKASNARRVYATIANVRNHTAGFVPEGVYVPSATSQMILFNETYHEIGLKHTEIDFIEAHGTGTPVGDPIELNSIANVFCKGRKKPLLIGTIKSNIGHTEPAAGICGIIKAVLAFEKDMIAPNINYETPIPSCPALVCGDIQVVLKPTPLTGKYISVNSFGFGGANVHIILKKNPVEHSMRRVAKKIPKLVLYPATTEEGVQSLFDYVQNNRLQDGFYSLLNNLSFTSTLYKSYRGYTILKDNDKPISEVKHSSESTLKVWYVMTGMGCQWPGMGLSLMKVDIFSESMKRSAKVLKPLGINLLELLEADKNYLQQDRLITPAFVAITAIQVALVDLLNALGIQPDGIVGHSTGELVCAYADGCCTAEQTVLSAYWRGKAVETSNLPHGAMAAVGITWEEAMRRCPENVYPACHNADDSVTISGAREALEKFVEQLKSENIFARIVNAYGYAFHCNLIWPAANTLRAVLQKIITNPKPRSERWLSSSFVETEWDKPDCKMANAEYFVHNLMSSVHFNEVLKKIPSDAIIIEIGPHFLLQSILKRAIGPNATYMGLMKRNQDNVDFLLQSIGKLYTLGLDPKVERLYPPAKYPVPRTTPSLSDQMKWDHSVSWKVIKWQTFNSGYIRINIKMDATGMYLLDHCIEGRSLFPATGYLSLAWEALAIRRNKVMSEMAITVENFKIHHAVILSPSEQTSFYVAFLNATGDFEIVESNSLVASGTITFSMKRILSKPPFEEIPKDRTIVSGEDLYSEMKIYGYEYGPAFQGLLEMDVDGFQGLVSWNSRWIPYLDSLLLFFGIVQNCRNFPLPTGILSIKIDPSVLKDIVAERESKGLIGLPVTFNPNTQVCVAAGVEIKRLNVEPAPHRVKSEDTPTLEQYSFVPYIEPNAISEDKKIKCIQYMYACDEVVKQITTSSGDKRWNHLEFPSMIIQEFDVEDYIRNASEEHGLLFALKNILGLDAKNQVVHKKKEIFQAYIQSIQNDMMYNTLVSEKTIRIALDIITENSNRKLSLLEMHRELAIVSPLACKTMHRHNHKHFAKCIIVSPDSNLLDKTALSEHNIELKDLKNLSSDSEDVVISSFLSGDYNEFCSHIKTLISVTKQNGFILLFCKSQMLPAEKFLYTVCGEAIPTYSEDELERITQQEGLSVISKLSDCFGSSLYLLRNTASPSHATNKILKLEEGHFEKWVDELRVSIAQEKDGLERIWLVSDNSSLNGVIGLVNCLRQEPGGERIRCIFISSKSSHKKLPPFSLKDSFYTGILKKDLLMNVYKDGHWGSFRHLAIDDAKKSQSVDNCYLNCTRYGDLSSFQWIESPVSYQNTVANGEELAHVYYTSINFKDVMVATGKISAGSLNPTEVSDCDLGFEFSGRNTSGNRIMGVAFKMALSTTLYSYKIITHDVPDHWTLEQASTITVVYSTCYLALIIRGQLQRGESVLIHSGTGGIGQAAIRIALSLDCEIFTTVGNELKKKYLKKKFPQIKDENIGCSRDVSFENLIMERTSGNGVDVVLNSLADDKFKASVRCVANHGRFLEIGKYDLLKNNPLGLGIFLKNVSFHGVCFDMYEKYVGIEIHDRILNQIKELLTDGIKSGVVQPLDITVFQHDEAEQAFRYMAAGTHVGKVVIKIRDEEADKLAIPGPLKLAAVPVTYFYGHKVYIIVGGLGGFGIELTKWLVKKGAKHIVLTTRFGARTPYHHLCLRRWKKEGTNVTVSTLNVAKKEDAKKLLLDVSINGPVGGIFNSALVLKDAFMENQTVQHFEEVCAPKATATKHLDELSRSLCPSLDYFVCFSSISCGKGNAGQTNYGYANSVMERICEQRVSMGLHGLAVQWGIIGDVGIVHRHVGDDARIAGVRAQSVKSCLDALDTFCRLRIPVVSSYVNADTAKVKENHGDVLSQIAKIFGLSNKSEFNVHRSLNEMGMDSMIGVEVKHLLETHCETTISIQELNEMKIEDVKNLVEKSESSKKRDKPVLSVMTTSHISLPKYFIPSSPITHINAKNMGIPIFIVCMGDGEVAELSSFAEELTNITFVVQWTKDTPMVDIQSMAKWYLQEINKLVGAGPIHVIGYRLGASLAFEMAVQSKNLIKLKTFCILDGSLTFIKSLDAQQVVSCDEDSLLIDFVAQFIPDGMQKLKSELVQKKTLELKVTTVINALLRSSTKPVNKNDLTEAIYAFIKRKNIIHNYVPNVCIENNITIIESSSQLLANEVSVVKPLICKVCSGKIIIHRVASNSSLLCEHDSIKKTASILEAAYAE